jgi:hypothetical protein
VQFIARAFFPGHGVLVQPFADWPGVQVFDRLRLTDHLITS